MPPGPWTIILGGRPIETPSADPALLYQNVLVALNRVKGINNGEPFLHAAWMGKVAPQPGEIVSHVGAGTGYYSALLSMLVLPDGKVHAFEIDRALARQARKNLEAFENVDVHEADATKVELPESDIVYVNAGVVAPPIGWLRALSPHGRMVFPWRPTSEIGLAVLVSRRGGGFACQPFMGAWFIPCVGASDPGADAKLPSAARARQTRSLWISADRAPDDTATAVFGEVWFSSEPPP